MVAICLYAREVTCGTFMLMSCVMHAYVWFQLVVGDTSNEVTCPNYYLGPLAFDMEYARWLGEHQRQINDLRSALNSHLGDDDLRLLVDAIMSHYDEVFRLKIIATKCDMLHMLSGMWTTPVERCFMWLGGFRSSELLKVSEYLYENQIFL